MAKRISKKKKAEWKMFEAELVKKYGENYRSKWNPEEFKKYMKLKNIKLDHMSTGAYCHKADPVSRRESGIYQAHKK